MLDRDLGQEEPAIQAQGDEQAVAADFNIFRRDGFQPLDHADLDLQVAGFLQRNRLET